jgi:hypothetical protein
MAKVWPAASLVGSHTASQQANAGASASRQEVNSCYATIVVYHTFGVRGDSVTVVIYLIIIILGFPIMFSTGQACIETDQSAPYIRIASWITTFVIFPAA